MPEAIWLELCCDGRVIRHGVVSFFGFGGRDIAYRLEQPPVVGPVHLFKCGIFDRSERPTWSASVDDLGLVESVDDLSQSVVVAVADTALRWLDLGVGKALSVLYRDVLAVLRSL